MKTRTVFLIYGNRSPAGWINIFARALTGQCDLTFGGAVDSALISLRRQLTKTNKEHEILAVIFGTEFCQEAGQLKKDFPKLKVFIVTADPTVAKNGRDNQVGIFWAGDFNSTDRQESDFKLEIEPIREAVGVHPITIGVEREVREALLVTAGFAFATAIIFIGQRILPGENELLNCLGWTFFGSAIIAVVIAGLDYYLIRTVRPSAE